MPPDHRTRSPLRERERSTSPQRGDEVDYGQDAEKHVRHIARTRQLATFAGQEGTRRDWPWVLHALVYRRSDRGTGCPVNILDTIIYCDGSPEKLFYTSGGNVVSSVISEDEGCITFPKAMMHLRLPKKYVGAINAASNIDSAARANGVVAFTSSGEAVAIKTADVEKIRKGQSTPPTGTEALVLLVPTKAPSAELLLSIQHTFVLEPCAAKPVHRSYRLVILKGVPTRIPCQSSPVNKKLCRLCKQVVLWIEAYSGARVLRLILEVVEDIHGHLWLVRSSECSTTKTVLPYSQQRRSPSPAQSKTARLQSAKGIADELSLLRYGHVIGESAPSHTPGLDIQATGPHRRAQTAMSPAEAGSQGTLDAEEWGFKRSESPSSAVRDLRRPQTVSTGGSACVTMASTSASDQGRDHGRHQEVRNLQSIGVTFQGFAAPEEHDPREIGRTAAAGRALGSSQLSRMCHGDFCNTDLLDKIQQQSRFEQEETGNGSLSLTTSPASPSGKTNGCSGGEGADTSAFRKRILKLDEATLQDYGVLPAEGGLLQSNRKRTAKSTRHGGGGTDGTGKRVGGGRELPGRRVSASGGGNAENTEWKEIPFSWVVRGRQESHLVDQQLRRYRRGNNEPFVGHLSGLGESSVSLGAVFPATYYQPVRVCGNCYRVYSMIDEARTKSVKRLDDQAEAAAAAAAGTGVGIATRTIAGNGSCSSNRPQWQSRAAKRARGGPGPWRASRVHASTARKQEDGEGEQDILLDEKSDSVSGESLALMRAQAAIDELTRGDICELRSFAKPPAAVNMVAAALMIALTGHGEPTAAGWLSAKRYMTNIDKLFGAVAGLDLGSLRVSQTRKLEAYARNPAFRPDVVACVSLPASKICAWILGVLLSRRNNGMDSARPWTSATTTTPSRVAASLGPAVYPFPSSTTNTATAAGPPGASSCQPTEDSRTQITAGGSRATSTEAFNPRRLSQPKLPPQAWVPAGVASGSGAADATVGSPSRMRTAPATASGSRGLRQAAAAGSGPAQGKRERGKTTRAGRAAAKRRQDRVDERLANATAAAPDPAGFEGSEFLCADGVTLMPYAVVGKGAPLLAAPAAPTPGGPPQEGHGQQARYGGRDKEQGIDEDGGVANRGVLSFVVVHDFFDTFEKTFLLFKPLVLKYPGCQVLCFNSPGQAGTRVPPEPEGLLTNTWVADRLDELMQHVDNMGEMPLSDRPFHLLGIGNGASIAAAFACRHASKTKWRLTLRSLACVNGFATVDAQLAAVLHSAQRAFQCFPPERPDLPISFWSRFVFSEEYLKSVGPDLALNILCAVANPLGAEGMLRIVRGALKSRDLTKDIKTLTLPLVLVQSTENMLIDAANVDPFLEGRHARHVWSHQLRLRPATVAPENGGNGGNAITFVSCLGPSGEQALFESLSSGAEGAFVAWVKGGHETRQECKRLVVDLLDLLAAPGGQTPEFFQRSALARRPPGSRVGITANATSTTAATNAKMSGAAVEKKSGDGSPPPITIGSGDNHPTVAENGDRSREVEVAGATVIHSGTAVTGYEQGGEQHHKGQATRWVADARDNGGKGASANEGGESGLTYGYASLRKIREREPLPESGHPPPGLEDADASNWMGEDGDVGGRVKGDGVLTLEAAVADFDVALRDHRNRRRDLGSTSIGAAELTDNTNKSTGSRIGARLHDTEASNWLDGEAVSWATVDLGMDTDPFDWCPVGNQENERSNEAARNIRRDGTGVSLAAPATPSARSPRTSPALEDAGVSDTARGPDNIEQEMHGDGLELTPERSSGLTSSPSPKRAGCLALGAPDVAPDLQRSNPTNPSASAEVGTPAVRAGVAATGKAASLGDLPSTASSSLPPSSPITTERAIKSGVAIVTAQEKIVQPDHCTKNDPSIEHDKASALGGQISAATGGTEKQQHFLGSPMAAAASVPCENAAMPEAAVVNVAASVPASKTTEAVVPATAVDSGTAAGTPTAATAVAPQTSLAMECPDPVATVAQRTAGDWMEGVGGRSRHHRLPAPLAVAEAEAGLEEKVKQLQSKRLAAEREERQALEDSRASKFGQESVARADRFAEEDRETLADEERRLAEIRREADLGRMQRGVEFQEADEALAVRAPPPAATTGATPMPVRGMRPQHFAEQEDLPEGIKKALDRPADKVLDEMEGLEARAKAAGGGMSLEAFERVEQRQRARQVERMEILHGQTAEEKSATLMMMAVRLQMFGRRTIARIRVTRLRRDRSATKERVAAVTAIQSLVRAHLCRMSVRRLRKQLLDETILGGRATLIQKTYRGRLARLVYDNLLRDVRRVAARKRETLARFAARASSATKLQSAWRGKMARDSYLRARCSWLASREIQRMYRGHLGRRTARRRREWQSAGPGPERLKLGLRMIEDTKVAFAKQQGEIAALNRAQEKAEARVSSIHHQLTASESELSVLEGEMAEIDHIERELVQLTHERDLIGRGITGAAGIRKTGKIRKGGGGGDGGDDSDGDDDDGGGGGGGHAGGIGKPGLRKEDAYALEMQLQLKRAEREQRRLQLSVEFASTFADVSEKKRQLDRLSAAVADIEATRLRKSREFGHMQRNLMELLSEQKRELDIVREKGVQLETAAATSAAAAAATAQRARDHEAKAAAMYGQTEELMKFQFMSMSLSYFSSLNMMKQMRDINADTTTAAIAGSADAAAAAAASAAAASIPSLKHTGDLGGDAVSHALAGRREQVQSTQAEIEEAKESQRHPFPTELSLWTVDDVCRWLDTLQLGEYKQAFREGKVDGSFLGELRESDLMDSIGMEHKLHLKKLLLARQKLTPLSAAEQSMASSVRREESATATREGIPDVDTAFSQARHGKKKRLEETLNTGFDINAEDAMGNTLLLVAVQQLQMPVVEFLVQRGANVNHGNGIGNTPLHFAMSYDTSGKMGEYLINNGADDTIENKQGLSPYDGI
eukprot:g16677.t1